MWVKKISPEEMEHLQEEEKRKREELKKNLRTVGEDELIHDSFLENCSKEQLFIDMLNYAPVEGQPAPLVPFIVIDWPIYKNMSEEQLAWYFYWRSQMRQGTYLPTRDEYVYLYIYEILSGVGWKIPQDGYDRLLRLWMEYNKDLPYIRNNLFTWIFDFAELHGLEHTFFFEENGVSFVPSANVDRLIELHADDVPLKLTFDLIFSLCDHPFDKSKFYEGENKLLVREALPRVIALADAALVKKTKKGILKTYGPKSVKTENITIFENARCPDRYRWLTVTVKPYSKNKKLRGYITELVRYTENVLRDIKGYRGRLQGITLDHETAKLIESFLRREYDPNAAEISDNVPEINEKGEVSLNFENIGVLREQSNAVRTALEVDGVENASQVDTQEIIAKYDSLCSKVLILLNRLEHSSWKSERTSEDEVLIEEINNLAKHPLGCNVLEKVEKNSTEKSDPSGSPKRPKKKQLSKLFNVSTLQGELKVFIEQITFDQQKILHTLLTSEHPERDLERIAEELMTLPHILLDEINETALQILGDLLVESIDQEPRVLAEYIPLLKESIT
jgi:hypothetical protein